MMRFVALLIAFIGLIIAPYDHVSARMRTPLVSRTSLNVNSSQRTTARSRARLTIAKTATGSTNEVLGIGTYPIEVQFETFDHTFGVQITGENLETKKKFSYVSNQGSVLPSLGPGRYRLLTEASRKGFPQEAKYEIVEAATGKVMESIVKSHVVRRDDSGKLPESLMTMAEEQLTKEFEQRLLWMLLHNIHRPAEGGGYSGKTFLEDLEEAKEKVKEWPEVSRKSTEILRGNVAKLEREADTRGLDRPTLLFPQITTPVRGFLKQDLQDLTSEILGRSVEFSDTGADDQRAIKQGLNDVLKEWAEGIEDLQSYRVCS